MSIIRRIVQAGSRWASMFSVGSEIKVKRTHHQFIHPTKGWRMFARPGKANSRRKLIRQGMLMVPESHDGGVYLRKLLGGWRLGRCRPFFYSVFPSRGVSRGV